MAHLAAGFPRFSDVFGKISFQSIRAVDVFIRNFATWMFSSACIGDSRQEQDGSFQDVLMAVESQVMTILLWPKFVY